MRAKFLVPAMLAFLWSGLVPAHDLWLERDGAGYLLYQGHRHSGHPGADRVTYGEGFVTGARCAGPAGEVAEVAAGGGYPARFPGPCAALLVETSSGVWTKTVHGTRNRPPGDLKGVVASWRSVEAVKRLDAWGEALAEPLGTGLEITPTHDPFALAVGDKLRLRVTRDGAPRAGVPVAYHGDVRGVTGEDGRINLRIRHRGLQMVTASEDVPAPDAPYAKTVHGAVLHFHLGSPAP